MLQVQGDLRGSSWGQGKIQNVLEIGFDADEGVSGLSMLGPLDAQVMSPARKPCATTLFTHIVPASLICEP